MQDSLLQGSYGLESQSKKCQNLGKSGKVRESQGKSGEVREFVSEKLKG